MLSKKPTAGRAVQNSELQKRFDMTEKAKNKKPGVKSFIGGTILTDERVTRQIPFIIFLSFLALLLITNRNWSERTIRKMEIMQDTMDNLRSESITLSSKLMNASRPSEVQKKVEKAGLDLQEPVRPPKKLNVNKKRLWIFGK
jgi:hypothetical protein